MLSHLRDLGSAWDYIQDLLALIGLALLVILLTLFAAAVVNPPDSAQPIQHTADQ